MPGFLDTSIVAIPHVSKRHRGGALPEESRRVDWDAYDDFVAISGLVVVDGLFRTPELSLWAIKNRKGAMPPAFSAHGFGLAVDLEVVESMKLAKVKTKKDFDALLAEHHFYCHRRDGKIGFESWHYNWLPDPPKASDKFTSTAVERVILDKYAEQFVLDKYEVQRALADLHLYGGAIDGIHGPRTKAAILTFQGTWGLKPSGVADKRTQRVLAYVAWASHEEIS